MLFSNGSYDSSSLGHIDCNFVIPVHCHQLDFVNYFHYNDIIFSQTAQGTSFTYVKICTYLIENTKYLRVYTHIIILFFFVFFFFFFFFWQLAIIAKSICVHFIFTISYITHVFATSIPIGCSYLWQHPFQNHKNPVNAVMDVKEVAGRSPWVAKIWTHLQNRNTK